METAQNRIDEVLQTQPLQTEESLKLIDLQLSATNQLVKKMSTRMHRLGALDVIDAEERWLEVQRRLHHEGASQLMMRTIDNMTAVEETMSNSMKYLQRIECTLDNISMPLLDMYANLRDCTLIFMLRDSTEDNIEGAEDLLETKQNGTEMLRNVDL